MINLLKQVNAIAAEGAAKLIFTRHATIRCQQRRISCEVINTILRLGQKEYRGNGCFMVYIPKKKAELLGLSEEVVGVAIIISNGIIITVEHIYKRIEKKFHCDHNRRRQS